AELVADHAVVVAGPDEIALNGATIPNRHGGVGGDQTRIDLGGSGDPLRLSFGLAGTRGLRFLDYRLLSGPCRNHLLLGSFRSLLGGRGRLGPLLAGDRRRGGGLLVGGLLGGLRRDSLPRRGKSNDQAQQSDSSSPHGCPPSRNGMKPYRNPPAAQTGGGADGKPRALLFLAPGGHRGGA